MDTATEVATPSPVPQTSQSRREQLIEELKAPRVRYDRLARQFGVSELQIRDFHINVCGRWVQSKDSWGRPELRKYAVARRHVDGEWDEKSTKITDAKREYDEGLCELATGRDGFWLILYKFPLSKKDTLRRPYFGYYR